MTTYMSSTRGRANKGTTSALCVLDEMYAALKAGELLTQYEMNRLWTGLWDSASRRGGFHSVPGHSVPDPEFVSECADLSDLQLVERLKELLESGRLSTTYVRRQARTLALEINLRLQAALEYQAGQHKEKVLAAKPA